MGKIRDQIKSAGMKELAIFIAGLIPVSAITIATAGWGSVTLPVWVLIWAALFLEES